MVFKINIKNRGKQFSLLIKKSEERIKSEKILLREKLYNDSISRAYYSFFDSANALLVTKGLSAKTHAGVISLFSLHFIKTKLISVKYIKLFRRAKEAREEADYELLKKFFKEDAEEIIAAAEDFLQFVKENFNKK